MLDCPAQRLAYVAFRKRRDGAEQRVRDVSSGGRRYTQKTLRPAVESGHALQQQLAQAARKLPARVAGGGEKLLGEEGVALGAGDDLVRQPRRQRAVGTSREQRRQLVAFQRPEVEQDRRSRTPDAIREAAHALRRRRLVRAVGGEQQNRPAVEVVREEDGEIERRGIRPVQVLEHEQHRCGGCSVGEQRERVLEDLQLRAGPRLVDRPRLPERTKGLEERLIRQLCADEVDRAPEQDLEPGGRGHVPRARTRVGSCRCPLLRRRGWSHRFRLGSHRARARAPRARVRVRRRPRSREPSLRPVSRTPTRSS